MNIRVLKCSELSGWLSMAVVPHGSPQRWALVQLCPGCCAPASVSSSGAPWARNAAPSLHVCHSQVPQHGLQGRLPAQPAHMGPAYTGFSAASAAELLVSRVRCPAFGSQAVVTTRPAPGAQGCAAVPVLHVVTTFLSSVPVSAQNGNIPSNKLVLRVAEA